MSGGHVDEEALAVAKRASADAARRGLKIVSMTVHTAKDGGRSFAFGYEAIPKARRGRQPAAVSTEPPPVVNPPRQPVNRGVRPRPEQGSLF